MIIYCTLYKLWIEFKTFKSYIAENGINTNLDILSSETGISVKNINLQAINVKNANLIVERVA